MSSVAVTPIKANQVRAFKNKQGKVNFYLIMKPDNLPKSDKLFTCWLRNTPGEPLHISSTFNMAADHPLIIEDINTLSSAFLKIYKHSFEPSYVPPPE